MGIKTKLIGALKTVVSQKKSEYFTSAVIVAGGTGSRMGLPEGMTKQFAEICGIPAVIRSISAFEACPLINEIILVARKDEFPKYRELFEKYKFPKIKKVVPGGETRSESVLRGIEKVSDDCEFLAIHDAARCLITPELIEKTAYAAYEVGAAAPCHTLTDTVKTVNGNYVDSTPDRDSMRAIETPQIIRAELYLAAADYAEKNSLSVTDDCSLIEALGYAVKLVESDGTNIKITHRHDIAAAESIIAERGYEKDFFEKDCSGKDF